MGELKQPQCDFCYSSWRWTKPAYSKHEILQVGCWCQSVYNIVDGEYSLLGQRQGHPVFWKELRQQWNEALKAISASTVKTKDV